MVCEDKSNWNERKLLFISKNNFTKNQKILGKLCLVELEGEFWGGRGSLSNKWEKILKIIRRMSQATVAHACNPSYLVGWDWEDYGLRPVLANSLWDPISKITRAKWTGGVA
jgi:hypothetical protein